ncbi:hypothetical protein DXG01_011409 [Tephrocybe rancida]|nr:hypothetical protein DXG01_011409 [Tephrocybe rancida]
MATSDKKSSLSNLAESDDDLEDLDDVLDQFTPQTPGLPPPPPSTATATTFGRPRTNTRVDAPPKSVPGGLGQGAGLDSTVETDEDQLSADFSRELAKGMENLMREISMGAPGQGEKGKDKLEKKGGDAEGGPMNDEELAKAFKAAWEQMLVEGMDGMAGNDLAGLEEFLGSESQGPNETKGKESKEKGPAPSATKNSFQDKIQKSLDKMREGESTLKGSTEKGAGGPPKDLEALLASLGGDGENDEDFAGLMDTMMNELMSKDILYEPIKELADKAHGRRDMLQFPSYLANPPAPISAEDRQRYEQQLASVHKILAVFDDPSYNGEDPAVTQNITALMAELQEHGSPPEELMGNLPTGMGIGEDGLPTGDCVIA